MCNGSTMSQEGDLSNIPEVLKIRKVGTGKGSPVLKNRKNR